MLEIVSIRQIGIIFSITKLLQIIWIFVSLLNIYRLINNKSFIGAKLMIAYPIFFVIMAILQLLIGANSSLNVIEATGSFDAYAAIDDIKYVLKKSLYSLIYASITVLGLISLPSHRPRKARPWP